MMTKRLSALTLALLAWSSVTQAATVTARSNSAGMEVGLRIVETCSIRSDAGSGTSVDCQHGTPYAIQSAADGKSDAPIVTVAF